jgi:hypothetical protein
VEQQALDCWNREAHPDFPRAEKLTTERRKAIRRATDLVPLDQWPKAIQAVNAWPWAHGEGEGNTWKNPGLDWFTGNDKHRTPNILRAIEGQLSGPVAVRRAVAFPGRPPEGEHSPRVKAAMAAGATNWVEIDRWIDQHPEQEAASA